MSYMHLQETVLLPTSCIFPLRRVSQHEAMSHESLNSVMVLSRAQCPFSSRRKQHQPVSSGFSAFSLEIRALRRQRETREGFGRQVLRPVALFDLGPPEIIFRIRMGVGHGAMWGSAAQRARKDV